MKLSTAFVIVLPSLVTLSFVTEDVLTAPRDRAEPEAGAPGSPAAIAPLVEAHHGYLAQIRSTTGPRTPHSCN